MSVPGGGELSAGPDLAPVLVALLRREGMALLDQRRRLNGLLRDYAPTAIRDIRLLLVACEAGAPGRLERASDPLDPVALSTEADGLATDFGCARPLALNAVETWGRALAGLRRPAGPAASPPPVGGARAAGPVEDDDRPGVIARWGGIVVAGLLVLVALARGLGLI